MVGHYLLAVPGPRDHVAPRPDRAVDRRHEEDGPGGQDGPQRNQPRERPGVWRQSKKIIH
jgi:hypothetical protein